MNKKFLSVLGIGAFVLGIAIVGDSVGASTKFRSSLQYILSGGLTVTGTVDLSGATLSIAADSITAAEIAAGAVGTSEIADASIAEADIADDAVTAGKILAGAVDLDRLALAEFIGADPPATCTAGAWFIDTDETDDTNCTTTADNSLCLCVATDTWVALENN